MAISVFSVDFPICEQVIWQGFSRLRDVAKIQYAKTINEFSFYAHVCTIFLIVMALAPFSVPPVTAPSPALSHFQFLLASSSLFPHFWVRMCLCLFPHNVIKCLL